MRAVVFVLGIVLVAGQRQSRPSASPAVLLASNARTQQERLYQQSQDTKMNAQIKFNTATKSIFDQTRGEQSFGNSESGQPVFRQNVDVKIQPTQTRAQQQERLFQQSQNSNINSQDQFNTVTNSNFDQTLGVQTFVSRESGQPIFNQNRPTQGTTTHFSGRPQEERSQQTRQDTHFINQKQLLRQSQDSFPVDGVFEPLNLPSGAYFLMGQIDTSFSCADRPYGYYADQGNDCRVFHVCNPYFFSDGRVETQQYSFMCNEHTVFDQKQMTCVDQNAANPCQESYLHYSRNEEFGHSEKI